ncbi:MAG: hypothetical protein ACUVTP_11495 [Candidatus Fervidibacter sp.]|uniref:hypothetical protein n=1 Tax=Candidatus Fervidibacter sp. TaxID=3100871 RepID=UPI00404A3F07
MTKLEGLLMMQWVLVVLTVFMVMMGKGMGQVISKGEQVLFESRTPEDFQKWFIWDTRPDRPGLVRRFDVTTYFGKPACTVEDISLSHDPRLASPPFAIPSDRWLRITVAVASDEPRYFFTVAFEYQERKGDQVTARHSLPFTVFATDRWRTATLLVPPTSIVTPKGNYTHAQIMVYPVLFGSYFGQCWMWFVKAGRVHLANLKVEAMPANWQPKRDDRRNWFAFATQLLPLESEPLISFEFLHHKPAGAKGFVQLHPDGYLVFEDGTPVRFWGVAWHEFAPRHLSEYPIEEQQRAAKTLAALGVNFVRWHGVGRGLWNTDKGELIDDTRWQNFDRLLTTLSEHGIYHQFTLWFFDSLLSPRDLLPPEIRDEEEWWQTYKTYGDYHQRKWAIFCFQSMLQRMLDLQGHIMAHVNPHQQKRYADDPAIVIVQPINEVSLLQRSPNDHVLLWNLSEKDVRKSRILPVSVYRTFTAEWNEWLRQRFRTADELFSAFPELKGELKAFEVTDADLDKVNIPLPPDRSTLWRILGRDEVLWYRLFMEFAMEREKRFYDEFAQRMRKLGYRNALAGDAGGVWRGCLFTQENLEVGYDMHHPYTDGESRDDFLFALNNPYPLQPAEGIYEAQVLRAWGRATVISEWGAGTVNEYRAMLAILTATYGAMHQISAIAEHSWGYPFGRPDHFLGVSFGFGNIMGDPARIGVYPVAATLFCLPEAITPLPLAACQLFTDEDLVAPTRGMQGSENAAMFYAVPYLNHIARVRWSRWDGQSSKVPDADLLYFPITSGVGNLKAIPADKKLFIIVPPEVLYSGWKIVKPYERVLSLYPDLRFIRGRFKIQVNLPNGYEGVRDCEGRFMKLTSLPKGATPIGVDEGKQICWGFYDERALVISDASVLQPFIPAALDTALKAWGKLPKDRGLVSRWELVSSTGQLRRNWQNGWVTIDSDYGQVLMGDLSKMPATRYLTVRGVPQFGVIALVPLVRLPLPQARRWLLVAVGRVANIDYDAVYNEPIGVYRLSGVRLKTGRGPAVCEPLQATVTLRGLGIKGCRVVTLTPQLTEKQEIEVKTIGDQVFIPLGKAESIWLLVEGTTP